MASELNIYQKLAKVRKVVEVVQKNKSGYGYKYVTDDELFAKITACMDKYELSLLPDIVPNTTRVTPYSYTKLKKEKTKDGFVTYEEPVNEILVQCDMKYTWVNNDDPEERIEVNWAMVGQQTDASQSFGSGLTYSMRYFILKYFDVSTPEDDPDKWRSKQREAAAAEDKALTEQLIKEVDKLVKGYLSDNPDKGEEVKGFIAKFVKGGNYFTITEPTLAGKLLDSFKESFVPGIVLSE